MAPFERGLWDMYNLHVLWPFGPILLVPMNGIENSYVSIFQNSHFTCVEIMLWLQGFVLG